MRRRKGLIQLGLVLAFPFLIGALCLNSSYAVSQSLWNSKHFSNYIMTTQTITGSWGDLDVQVIVQNNKIIDEKLLECEVGQPEYDAQYCKGVTVYTYKRGGEFTHTVDNLFQIAQTCTEKTTRAIWRAGLYQVGFNGFTSSNSMYDYIAAHHSSWRIGDKLCSVEYDPKYGYPKEIALAIPTSGDGDSIIWVKNFRVDD